MQSLAPPLGYLSELVDKTLLFNTSYTFVEIYREIKLEETAPSITAQTALIENLFGSWHPYQEAQKYNQF